MKGFLETLRLHVFPAHENAFRPHLLTKPWLLFFLTILLTSESIFAASFLLTQTPASSLPAAVVPAEVIALTNVERAQNSAGVLTENHLLDLAAQNKADDMAAKGYFSHVSPDGTQPWSWILGTGYNYQDAGENLAVRFDNSSDVVNAWMASPTHRANIVKPVYTEIGVAVAQGTYQGTPATFIVQYFGTPATAPAGLPLSAATSSAEHAVQQGSPRSAQVAGVSTEKRPTAASTTSPTQSLSPAATVSYTAPAPPREDTMLARIAARAGVSANWILLIIAALALLLVGVAIIVHIEIQPTDMLLGGAFVVVVALVFMALNVSVVNSALYGPESASVYQSQTPSMLLGSGWSAGE